MKGFYPGTFIADKLDFSNRIRRRITISILVLSDSFCLTVALVESGFWAKTINPNLTWANATSYLSGQQIGLQADPISLVNLDQGVPVPTGSGAADILTAFLIGIVLFLFLKVVIGLAFRGLRLR